MPLGGASGRPNDLAWTAKEKRFFAGVSIAAILAVALWMRGSTSMTRVESCGTCSTSRSTWQWGIGTCEGGAFLAAETDVEIRPSDLSRTLPRDHVHAWRTDSVSTTVLGWRRYIGCTMNPEEPARR